MDLIKILKNKLADSNKEEVWLKSYKNAIKVLNNKYIDIETIQQLFISSNSIEHFDSLVSVLYQDSKLPSSNLKSYKKIFKYSKGESLEGRSKKLPIKEFSIGDWIESLYIIKCWLDNKDQTSSLDSQIEYIGCSAEINVDGGMSDLKDIVSDYLDIYGFDNNFN
jgi:hypothetical protein|tara:strand:+ start:265 stop:759 length:495 start_codon:yes stop_codon:yes gene_type:complete